MASAQELIKGAALDLTAIASGQNPTGEESADAFVLLNQMADAMGLERLLLYSTVRTPTALGIGTSAYSIGVGGAINMTRPTWIDRASVILDTGTTPVTERPIRILDDAEYAVWPQKTQRSSPPQAIWYDHASTAGLGTVTVLPVPDLATTQLVLYTPGGEVAQFADLGTDYTFPRGFERALRKNLALELAPMFSAQPSPLLIRQALDSLAALKRSASRATRLRCDPGLVSGGGGRWSINSDSYAWPR